MARRMFNQQIVGSDAFIGLPLSAQALYFHLNMEADDDGVVNNAKRITGIIGASNDDLDLLIEKRFILKVNDLIVIKHWFINNVLRRDRKKLTVYNEVLETLELKENGAYTDRATTKIQPVGNQNATKSQTNGCINKDNINKDKVREDNINNITSKKLLTEFEDVWKLYPRKLGKSKARQSYIKARKSGVSEKEISDGVQKYADYVARNKVDEKYIKHGSTWFNQECWNDDYNTKGRSKIDWMKDVDL